jgi:hypothetical protein
VAAITGSNTDGPGFNGPAFLIAATLTYDAIAKACSSPQTAEINADKRAGTLMKWVNVGTAEAMALVIFAAWVDPRHRFEILLGGGLAAAITYGEYLHAKKSGLEKPGPSTEG